MSTIGTRKVHTHESIAPGHTVHSTWNNPPWNTVLGYFAYPVPVTPSGEHGSHSGTVEVTRVTCHHLKKNDGPDDKHVTIYVKNCGDEMTGAEVWQSWIG